MHVAADLNWFLQFIVLAFAGAFGLLYLVRNTASRYFVVDSNFDSSAADYSTLDSRKRENMGEAGGGAAESFDSCAVCGLLTKKQCARCKMVKYCSEACQKSHWNSEHKKKCKDLQLSYKANHTKPTSALRERKASVASVGGSSKILKQSNKVLFPYEEFVKFFSWNKPGYPPCGLINCGNSCFANVVLQCLAFTRPLVAYLLEKGHRIECQRDDWCFLCEFQTHVERASRSLHPFSPMNILSRLPNIGGNLGYGKQEDAHEFMRFAIDTMQSVCLDEFGGEKAVHHSYQETTLIQHIFGGRLRSQVICAECNNISNQFENMMDLTVEIHGDAGSLEECLDQFTAKEWLHGDNMYKCDGCNAYVMAWKRLAIQRAPNILTIALKRFQSGRFGKLNKRVTFPETLDLSPYMSELEDGNDVYKLYAVIVHVDMLNASFFGHYICYIKDFGGNWYRIDDCKVASVDLDEVLSQGAYMLLYSRICARPSCLLPKELLRKEESGNVKINEVEPSLKQPSECLSDAVSIDSPVDSGQSLSTNGPVFKVNCEKEELSFTTESQDARDDIKTVCSDLSLPIVKDIEIDNGEELPIAPKEVASPVKQYDQPNPTLMDNAIIQLDANGSELPSSVSDVDNASGGSKNDVNVDLLRKLTEEPAAAENCTFENGSTTCDVSAMDITTDEVRDEVSVANSTSMPESIGYGNGLSSSDDIQIAAKKSNGANSVAKFKPLFARGFLEKHPRTKCTKPERHLNIHTNEVAESSLSCENGGILDEEKPHIIHENGKASMEPYIYKSLENGGSGVTRGSS
ncbi:hypothetical protein DH2020_006042 [Rehmannia glutinosa]|uniref:Ubiquitin carboxyl-terminal hydrolase n=1 Tax=Rehmannia glutinosa TaxID=99300 RepID=A0ABR0XIB0_REHGL